MAGALEALLPAEVRGRLRGLRLTARGAAPAQGLGLHHSRNRGAGLEFAQYRTYEPGDEPRMIDWKLYARADKFFVREAERESPLRLWILVDASASMAQSDPDAPGRSRLDAAREIAAGLALLALAGGDRFGLMVLGADGLDVVEAADGAGARDRLGVALLRLRAGGRFPDSAMLRPLWDRMGPQDLVVLLSDMLDDGAVALAGALAAAGREVVTVQILTVGERDFRFGGGYRFVDPETGAVLEGDADAMRAAFLESFGKARAALAGRLEQAGVRHCVSWLDEPADLPLRRLFGGVHAQEYG